MDPDPAITGTLPFTWSAQNEMTSVRSRGVMVLASPVVPQATMASVPCWKSRSFPRVSKSTPSFVKGVTMATPEPVKIGFFKNTLLF